MTLLNEFEQIEKIKKEHSTEYLIQKKKMNEQLSNISKSIIDSNNINYRFAYLVSDYLSRSDFACFGTAISEDTIIYVSDKGDYFSISFDETKKINIINYQSCDKKVNITLKTKRDKVYLARTVVQDEDIYRITKSEYKKNNNKYYQTIYSDKLVMKEDNLTTIGTEELRYDDKLNEVTKFYSMITKSDNKIISKSSISKLMDKSEYVIEDGLIHIVNDKKDYEILKKAKKLETKLVNKRN